jgi:hypothetical protein
MPAEHNPDEKVRNILKRKKASIKNAPLEPGSPNWDAILDMTIGEVLAEAKNGTPGYRTFKKLLTHKDYDRKR